MRRGKRFRGRGSGRSGQEVGEHVLHGDLAAGHGVGEHFQVDHLVTGAVVRSGKTVRNNPNAARFERSTVAMNLVMPNAISMNLFMLILFSVQMLM